MTTHVMVLGAGDDATKTFEAGLASMAPGCGGTYHPLDAYLTSRS